MTGLSGNRLSICPLRFRIVSPRVPIETLGEAILNISGQIDLPITLDTSHYLLNISPGDIKNLYNFISFLYILIKVNFKQLGV